MVYSKSTTFPELLLRYEMKKRQTSSWQTRKKLSSKMSLENWSWPTSSFDLLIIFILWSHWSVLPIFLGRVCVSVYVCVCVSREDTSCQQARTGSQRWGRRRDAARHGGAAPSRSHGTTQQTPSLFFPSTLHLSFFSSQLLNVEEKTLKHQSFHILSALLLMALDILIYPA